MGEVGECCPETVTVLIVDSEPGRLERLNCQTDGPRGEYPEADPVSDAGFSTQIPPPSAGGTLSEVRSALGSDAPKRARRTQDYHLTNTLARCVVHLSRQARDAEAAVAQANASSWPECPICLAGIVPAESFTTDCKHTFHRKCFRDWFASTSQRSCPICRAGLDPGGRHGWGKRTQGSSAPPLWWLQQIEAMQTTDTRRWWQRPRSTKLLFSLIISVILAVWVALFAFNRFS